LFVFVVCVLCGTEEEGNKQNKTKQRFQWHTPTKFANVLKVEDIPHLAFGYNFSNKVSVERLDKLEADLGMEIAGFFASCVLFSLTVLKCVGAA